MPKKTTVKRSNEGAALKTCRAKSAALAISTLVAFACGLSGCGESKSDTEEAAYSPPVEPAYSPPVEPNVSVAPVRPSHNYDLKEGSTYSYVSAVSENEKKAGKVAGDVVTFKFLGQKNGIYTVASLFDDGRIAYRAQCSNPCVIIKNQDGSRIAFDPSSIIGAVFEDAISGQLVTSRKHVAKPASTAPQSDEWTVSPPGVEDGNVIDE